MKLRGVMLVLSALFILAVVALSQAGRFVSSPEDVPVKADMIVALGGDTGGRVRGAQRLFAEGYAPRILLTGIEDGDPSARSVYLSWRVALLVGQGVPEEAILFDLRSGNSWQEAQNTRALMEQKGWGSVLVVSDPPHMRRLSWVWAKVFQGSGLEYRLIASPMPGWQAEQWWRHEKSGQFVLMELIKLGYYVVAH